MAKYSDKEKKATTKLRKLREERDELKERLKSVDEKIVKQEEKVLGLLGAGLHVLGKWACAITITPRKGARTPKYKLIVDKMVNDVMLAKEKLLAKYPDQPRPIMDFARKMQSSYNKGLEEHTTIGEDKEVVKIEISPVAS